MAEVLGMLVDSQAKRSPAAATYSLLYTSTAQCAYGIHVHNGEASDAIVDIFWLSGADATAYVDGAAPPAYSRIERQLVESDATSGSSFNLTALTIGIGDKIVVRSSIAGVTFTGHGIAFT